MWVSKKEWQVMEERVQRLENGVHINSSSAHKEPALYDYSNEPKFFASGFGIRSEYPQACISVVVQAILDHFGLKLRIDPAQGEKVRLEKPHLMETDPIAAVFKRAARRNRAKK